jgi:hypothetical protein
MSELEQQKKIAIELDLKHKAAIEENNPIAGPDCLTIVEIKTRLPFDNPFRIACPCKYSGMHKAKPWEEIPDQLVN